MKNIKHIRDAYISGIIYHFAAFLTTRERSITVGSMHNASPIVDAIKEYTELYGIEVSDADLEFLASEWYLGTEENEEGEDETPDK